MTKLEHFKHWAATNYPNIGQDGEMGNGHWWFYHDTLQIAWRAFQASSTIRPTENGRLNKEEFMKPDPETIVDRLRGIYPGVTGAKASPIGLEAAGEIERLRGELDIYNRSMHRFNTIEELMDHLNSTQ